MLPARAAQARNTSIAAGNNQFLKITPIKISGARGVMKETVLRFYIEPTTKTWKQRLPKCPKMNEKPVPDRFRNPKRFAH